MKKTTLSLCVLAWFFAPSAFAEVMQGSAKIQAAQRAILAAQVDGNITHIYVDEGEVFKKGKILFKSSCRRTHILLKSAKTELKALNNLLASSRVLLAEGVTDKASVREYEARQARIMGDVNRLNHDISICTVKAPYVGRVAKKELYEHDWAQRGQGVLEIISTEQLEAEVIVPIRALNQLKSGDKFIVRMTAIGYDIPAQIKSFNAEADANSQTIGLQAVLLDIPDALRPGMIGEAIFVQSK
ncbi:MAG: HlyD family efflux transporter periplasmic adaptor subunit [Mariprofundaceae bacterium]|nr:HlyD family efflux transporter periplasmic adaptor subunit [Mariprofundaceae bacterium]